MHAVSLAQVIDKAAKVCGSQNALAERVGATSSQMAQFRQGKRSIPNHIIERIAEVADMNAADVWLLAKDARNPFKGETGGAASWEQGQERREGARLNLWILALRMKGQLVKVLHIHDSARARRTSLPA